MLKPPERFRPERRRPTAKRQRGVAMIEFALGFSLVFALFWAIVSYTFPLILLQVMNRAVGESVRVVSSVPTDQSVSTYAAAAQTAVVNELDRQLAWLPSRWTTPLKPYVNGVTLVQVSTSPVTYELTVKLNYANYASNPIVPSMTLPGVGSIPALPVNLTAQAKFQP